MSKRALTTGDIDPKWRERIALQDYSSGPVIEGVQLIDLRLHGDDGGTFIELARLDDAARVAGLEGFSVRQVNHSTLVAGAVKAWHVHLAQDDLVFVPFDMRLLVGLVDLRAVSPSSGLATRLVLGGGSSRLLHIPRGVAHGVANPWSSPTSMFYFATQHFSTVECDEWRLRWDAFGADFWDVRRG